MQRKTGVVLVLVILCVALAAWFFFRRAKEILVPPSSQVVAPAPASEPPLPIVPLPPATTESDIKHPLETPPLSEPLPALDQSDAQVLNALATALGKKGLGEIVSEELIRHVVVTVDNLPRKQLPAKLAPLKPAQGAFVTSGEGESRFIDKANSVRYDTYIDLARAVNSARLVSVYAQFYPLFQKAYEELGYPKAYFNDRLVEAIDDLLATPEIDEPIRVLQPKVLFQFADSDLEGRSAGQKILLRMGRENAAKIKAKLAEIRRLVVKPL